MTLVVGTDEAGYGPNLGPLVVAATAWRVEAAPGEAEPVLERAVASAATPPLWGDSKRIYRAGAGLGPLERGVLEGLAIVRGGSVGSWPQLAAALSIAAAEAPERRELDGLALPLAAEARQPPQAGLLRDRLAAAGVRLEAIRCRIVQPDEFNGLLAAGLNKSDVLTEVTLGLAASVAALAAADEAVAVWCDRHGGRRRYAPQVARGFAAPLVQPLEETATSSRYRLDGRRTVEFTVGGEARAPVALASMTAKYVRELSMLAFNRHWGRLEPGLAATAGYPVDALRWRREAAAAVARAGIDWDAIWRRA